MSRERRLGLALVMNTVIIVVQVIFGLRARSLGLLADAGHNFTDAGALGLSLWAVRLSRRAPNAKQSYGYHRSGILSAQTNAVLILVATAWIIVEGVRRLVDASGSGGSVDGGTVIVVAAVALVVNGIGMWALSGHAHDLNMHSAFLHLAGDVAASIGVLLSGVVMAITNGTYWLDPTVSICIALLIGWRAITLLSETTDILMESTPKSVDITDLIAAIESRPEVEEIHDLHVWSLSKNMRAMSAHVVLDGQPTLEEAQVVGGELKGFLAHRFGIVHTTLELECVPCLAPDNSCLPLESVSADHHDHDHDHDHDH